jgi:hypothetical protein
MNEGIRFTIVILFAVYRNQLIHPFLDSYTEFIVSVVSCSQGAPPCFGGPKGVVRATSPSIWCPIRDGRNKAEGRVRARRRTVRAEPKASWRAAVGGRLRRAAPTFWQEQAAPWAAASRSVLGGCVAGSRSLGCRRTLASALSGAPPGVLALRRVRLRRYCRGTEAPLVVVLWRRSASFRDEPERSIVGKWHGGRSWAAPRCEDSFCVGPRRRMGQRARRGHRRCCRLRTEFDAVSIPYLPSSVLGICSWQSSTCVITCLRLMIERIKWSFIDDCWGYIYPPNRRL